MKKLNIIIIIFTHKKNIITVELYSNKEAKEINKYIPAIILMTK